MDENNSTPAEVPTPSPVESQNQTPAAAPAPPAATLAVEGEVTDERALAIARREAEIERREALAREVETNVSARERQIQEREAALRAAPSVPRKKTKREKTVADYILGTEPDEEA